MPTVGASEVIRVLGQVVQGVTIPFCEAGLDDGLIGVPGFSDGELLRPSAGGSSDGGEIMPVRGAEDLFGKRFRLTRTAVPCDDTLWRQLREAGKSRRNHRQARGHGLHEGNGQAFIEGREHEQIESGKKTRNIEAGAVEEYAIRDAK